MPTPGLVWLRDRQREEQAAAEASPEGGGPRRGGGRRNPLTRDALVAGAIELLDADGLTDLSIRALATHLSTSPASLYWHVAHKEELLDLVFDAAFAEVPLRPADDCGGDDGPGGTWQAEVRRLADELAALSARHPWWPLLYSTRPSIGPRSLAFSDRLIRTLSAAGFSGPGLDNAETSFYDLVVGHVLIATTWQTWLARTPHDIEQTQAYVLDAVRPHPALEQHVTGLFTAPDRRDADRRRFRFSVDVLIHGLEQTIAT